MVPRRACLVDLYETVLTCDFTAHAIELPAIAGIEASAWNEAFAEFVPAITDGRLCLSELMKRIIRACGDDPQPAVVRELVRKDEELVFAHSSLYDDAVPFLQMLRARGIATAFVSNCAENTRPLLEHLGVSTLVDSITLSCEVGCAKPSAGIYRHALDQLGVAAGDSIFVDDQAAYCAGAVTIGIEAVQIVRGEATGVASPTGTTVVRSLWELEPML